MNFLISTSNEQDFLFKLQPFEYPAILTVFYYFYCGGNISTAKKNPNLQYSPLE